MNRWIGVVGLIESSTTNGSRDQAGPTGLQ
jgi:hypothetical protein